MILYRYFREEHALSALQTGLWKVGRLLELNDPLDCQPLLRRGDGSVLSIENAPIVKQMFDRIGVVCYSRKINDPVIWSHYADGHKGIALGFEFDRRRFDSAYCVEYGEDNERPILEYDSIEKMARNNPENPFTAYREVIKKGFTRKAHSWVYESEYRHFYNLYSCRMNGRNYFTDVPRCLVQIVIGMRSNLTEFDMYQAACRTFMDGKFSIYKARQDDSKFEIELAPPRPESIANTEYEADYDNGTPTLLDEAPGSN